MKTQEEIDAYFAEKEKEKYRIQNSQWLNLCDYETLSTDFVYYKWLDDFCKKYQNEESINFVKKLYDSPEYKFYTRYKEIDLLKTIRFWIKFWSWFMIISGIISIIYILLKSV